MVQDILYYSMYLIALPLGILGSLNYTDFSADHPEKNRANVKKIYRLIRRYGALIVIVLTVAEFFLWQPHDDHFPMSAFLCMQAGIMSDLKSIYKFSSVGLVFALSIA